MRLDLIIPLMLIALWIPYAFWRRSQSRQYAILGSQMSQTPGGNIQKDSPPKKKFGDWWESLTKADYFPVVLVVIVYAAIMVAFALLFPETFQEWEGTKTKIFWVLWLALPTIVAFFARKAGVVGWIGAVVLITICFVGGVVGLWGPDFWKNLSPTAEDITPQSEPNVSKASIKLEPGVWHDLRAEGLLLLYHSFDMRAFGCLEVIYNQDIPRFYCPSNVHPDLPVSQGAVHIPENWKSPATLWNVRVRSLTKEIQVAIITNKPR